MSNSLHTTANSHQSPIIMGYGMEDALSRFDELHGGELPYTMDELNARLDEVEQDIEHGGGKSFDAMMTGFKKQLAWLR